MNAPTKNTIEVLLKAVKEIGLGNVLFIATLFIIYAQILIPARDAHLEFLHETRSYMIKSTEIMQENAKTQEKLTELSTQNNKILLENQKILLQILNKAAQ